MYPLVFIIVAERYLLTPSLFNITTMNGVISRYVLVLLRFFHFTVRVSFLSISLVLLISFVNSTSC